MERLDRLPMLLAGAALAVYLWRESLRRENALRSENALCRENALRREIASLRRENALRCENQSLRGEIASLRDARQPDFTGEVERLRQEMGVMRDELHILRRCLASREVVPPEAVAAQRHRMEVRRMLHKHPASELRFEDVCKPVVSARHASVYSSTFIVLKASGSKRSSFIWVGKPARASFSACAGSASIEHSASTSPAATAAALS